MSTKHLTTAEIPPAMRGKINQEQVDDAVYWWAQLTGKEKADWVQPGQPVTIQPHSYASMRHAAIGLAALARIQSIANGSADSALSDMFSCGLTSAMIALSDQISGDLERLESNC